MISKDEFDAISDRYDLYVRCLKKYFGENAEVIYVPYEFKNMEHTRFLFVGESPYPNEEEVTNKAFESRNGIKNSDINMNGMAKFWAMHYMEKSTTVYTGLIDNGNTIFKMSKELKINFINAYPIMIHFKDEISNWKTLKKHLADDNQVYVYKKGSKNIIIDLKNGWLDTLQNYYENRWYLFGKLAYERLPKGRAVLHPALLGDSFNFDRQYADYLGPKSIFRDVFLN